MTLIRDPRERAEAVEQWANLNGDDLETFWPDDETRWVIENALWCAGDVLVLLPLSASEPVTPQPVVSGSDADGDDGHTMGHG